MNTTQFTKFVDDAGGIVINKQTGDIALVKMPGGFWAFPKGKIDKDETALEAAKREIYEETGATNLELIKELPTYQRPNAVQPDELITMYMFLFKTETKELKQKEEDVDDARWFRKGDVKSSLGLSKDKEYFEKVLDEI